MATKETTKKAQADTSATEQESATQNSEATGTTERDQTRTQTEQEQREVIANLQTKAANALNELWNELRAQGYMVYNTILLLGIAFVVEKDENENFYFTPSDLNTAENYKAGNGKEEQEAAEVIADVVKGLPQANTKGTTKNITTNHGKFRSINKAANNNTPFAE